MNFTNVRGVYGRSYRNTGSYAEGKSIYSKSTKPIQVSKQRSLLNEAILDKNNPLSNGLGLRADKGTSASTTINIDKNTFNEIMDYTTHNSAYKWDEIGCDGVKKWVVVSGQRFDYSLNKEEREAFKKRWKIDTSAEEKAEAGKDKSKSDNKILTSICLDNTNKIKFDNEKAKTNTKLNNLTKNNKVVRILSDIMRTNNRRSINLDLG